MELSHSEHGHFTLHHFTINNNNNILLHCAKVWKIIINLKFLITFWSVNEEVEYLNSSVGIGTG